MPTSTQTSGPQQGREDIYTAVTRVIREQVQAEERNINEVLRQARKLSEAQQSEGSPCAAQLGPQRGNLVGTSNQAAQKRVRKAETGRVSTDSAASLLVAQVQGTHLKKEPPSATSTDPQQARVGNIAVPVSAKRASRPPGRRETVSFPPAPTASQQASARKMTVPNPASTSFQQSGATGIDGKGFVTSNANVRQPASGGTPVPPNVFARPTATPAHSVPTQASWNPVEQQKSGPGVPSSPKHPREPQTSGAGLASGSQYPGWQRVSVPRFGAPPPRQGILKPARSSHVQDFEGPVELVELEAPLPGEALNRRTNHRLDMTVSDTSSTRIAHFQEGGVHRRSGIPHNSRPAPPRAPPGPYGPYSGSADD